MTAYNDEIYFWESNKQWYGINENGEFYIKENAPKTAVESFKKFKQHTKNR